VTVPIQRPKQKPIHKEFTKTSFMTDPLRAQILKIASDVLEVPVEQLTDESSSEDLKTWDSIQHLTMVLALEQKIGIRFEPEEIERMTSLHAIEEIVRAKQ